MDDSNTTRPLTFILKRHKGSPLNYSFEFFDNPAAAQADGAPEKVKLWAQFKSGFQGKDMYVISTDVEELSKPRNKRNATTFRGKLVVNERPKVYVGYKQSIDNDDKVPLVSILYDHERASTTDRKMEVALPLVPMAPVKKDYTCAATPTAPAFFPLFMKIHREGWENLPPLEKDENNPGGGPIETHNDKVLVLTQACDDKDIMSSTASLASTSANSAAGAAAAAGKSAASALNSAGDVAAMVSTKNFALVLRQPSRPWSNAAEKPEEVDGNAAAAAAVNAPPSIFTRMVTTAAAATPSTEPSCHMSFGKLKSDVYCCKVMSDKISITTAFMICLSRFDTLQQY